MPKPKPKKRRPRPRSFSVDVPDGATAIVHGNPRMPAASRKALDEVLAVAAKQMRTKHGRLALQRLAKKAEAMRDAERTKPLAMKLPLGLCPWCGGVL